MAKDRLAELKGTDNGENLSTMVEVDMASNAGSEPSNGSSQSFSECTRQMKSIQQSLEQTSDKVTQMTKLHSTILSSPKSDPGVNEVLHKLTETVLQELSHVGKKLGAINKTAMQDHKSRTLTETEYRMIRTVYSSLIPKFKRVWEDFSLARNEYEQKARERIQRQMEIAGCTLSMDEVEEALAKGVPIFSREVVESQSAKQALCDLQERHEDFLMLEKGIREVRALFLEFNLVIENQGEVIDSIESNIHRAESSAEAGARLTAEEKAKKGRARRSKFKWIGISVVAVIVVLLIAAVILVVKLA